jgi:hypothetical protein
MDGDTTEPRQVYCKKCGHYIGKTHPVTIHGMTIEYLITPTLLINHVDARCPICLEPAYWNQNERTMKRIVEEDLRLHPEGFVKVP